MSAKNAARGLAGLDTGNTLLLQQEVPQLATGKVLSPAYSIIHRLVNPVTL